MYSFNNRFIIIDIHFLNICLDTWHCLRQVLIDPLLTETKFPRLCFEQTVTDHQSTTNSSRVIN